MDHAHIDDNKRYLTTETDTSCGNKRNKVLLKYTQQFNTANVITYQNISPSSSSSLLACMAASMFLLAIFSQ